MAVARRWRKRARKRGENQPNIGAARDVVGNDEHWSAKAAQIFPANDLGMPKNLRGRPDQRVVDGQPQPAHRRALRPARINVLRAMRRWLLQKPLHIRNGFCLRKGRFVQLNLKSLFERAHQLDAIQRREIQVPSLIFGEFLSRLKTSPANHPECPPAPLPATSPSTIRPPAQR